jgi:hypothetical protein
VLGLETRRIHEHELRVLVGEYAVDAVARRLRLARSDADLLPDQVVEQRGLAHVGPSDDGDEAAAEWFRRAFAMGVARKIFLFFVCHAYSDMSEILCVRRRSDASG